MAGRARVAQLGERLGLDLADPLAGDVEAAAHLVERERLVALEPEPQREDLPLAGVEVVEQVLEVVAGQRQRRHLEGHLGVVVGDEVAELGVVVADRHRQRHEVGAGVQRDQHPLLGHAGLLGQLGGGGLAPERLEQRGRRLRQHRHRVDEVGGQPDGAGLVGDAAADRLADPPGGVGGELEALAVVELLDRPHQAEVALLDEVEERHPGALVALGDRHHEAQVRLDERAPGRLGGRRSGCSSSALRARVGVVEDSSISARRPVSMAWASSTSCSAVSRGYDPSSLR